MTNPILVDAAYPGKWAFGKMPLSWKDKHRPERDNVKIGLIGCGNVVDIFFLPAFAHMGSSLYIFDPRRSDAAQEVSKSGINATMVHSLDELKNHNVDLVFNLTPPHIHLTVIENALASGLRVVATEKPIVVSSGEMQTLSGIATNNNILLPSIDWVFGQGQVPMVISGMDVPFPEFVDIKGDFRKFDWHNVTSISAHSVEGGGNVLGNDPSQVLKRQSMGDSSKGGGVLWDMIVHQLTLLSHMGFKVTAVGDVVLGDATKDAGVYHRFGQEEAPNTRGEMYGRAEVLAAKDDSAKVIPVTLECGKCGDHNHQAITFKDASNNTLHWQTVLNDDAGQVVNAGGNWAELRDGQGKLLGRAVQGADAYALVIENAVQQARAFGRGLHSQPSYLPAQENPTFAISAMHLLARSKPILETVYQLSSPRLTSTVDIQKYTPLKSLGLY